MANKLLSISVLTVAAFLTAATVRFTREARREVYMPQAVAEQKKFSIRCSALYSPSDDALIPVLPGWGTYRWNISTSSDSALLYFNQGINLYYAFHIIEARASFDKATRFDPNCAMAWWGKALAFGPNINDFGYEQPSEAYPSAEKAHALKSSATATEQALIDAMYVRYSDDSTKNQAALNVQYRDAMSKVYKQFPRDENVGALFADALMLLHPWDLYNHNFTPKPWTPEIVDVLKHTMQLNPKQPGAHHYYIHVVEASATPQDALASANFLAKAMPMVSHLTHMPSHIYIRSGYYDKGITVNDDALKGFEAYSRHFAPSLENMALYSLHNTHMKMNCAQMAGSYKIAMSAAKALQQDIPEFYLSIGGALGNYVQYLHQSPLFTQVRFGKWNDILAAPLNDTLAYIPVLQHFARGIAFARTNRTAAAQNELKLLETKLEAPVLKEPLAPFNDVYSTSLIGRDILRGTIAEVLKDYPTAVAHFKAAVVHEDKLIYNEPRDWLLPARHYLGNALIKMGSYKDAIAVFNGDLQINPNNGWALSGLEQVYKKMNNKTAIAAVQMRLRNAWLLKDVPVFAAVY